MARMNCGDITSRDQRKGLAHTRTSTNFTETQQTQTYTQQGPVNEATVTHARYFMSEESCAELPWWTLLCRSYGFVMVTYSPQQIIFYWAWRFHGCTWSMILQWRKSPGNVDLFARRGTSPTGGASGYTSSILVLKQVTRGGIVRILQRLLAFIRLPTCALYTPQENTDKHQFVAIWYN